MSATIPLRMEGAQPDGQSGKGVPREWHTLYDWALVWRYWNGQGAGLRRPYPLEQRVLMELGRGLSDGQLADRLGVHLRQVERWRKRCVS